jgi:hypothetical protein
MKPTLDKKKSTLRIKSLRLRAFQSNKLLLKLKMQSSRSKLGKDSPKELTNQNLSNQNKSLSSKQPKLLKFNKAQEYNRKIRRAKRIWNKTKFRSRLMSKRRSNNKYRKIRLYSKRNDLISIIFMNLFDYKLDLAFK